MQEAEGIRWRQGVTRTLSWHRRWVAAGCAGVCVFAALSALHPKAQPSQAVWTAAHDLAGARPLTAADVVLRRLPLPDVPAGALTAGVRVIGRLVAAPMRRGEPLTDVRLLEPSLLAALGAGLVAVPVRLADGTAAAALVHSGDSVDVIAAADPTAGGPATPTVVATAVRVLAVPARDGSSTDDNSTDSVVTAGGAGLVVVAATQAQAAALAQAAAGTRLSLVLRRS